MYLILPQYDGWQLERHSRWSNLRAFGMPIHSCIRKVVGCALPRIQRKSYYMPAEIRKPTISHFANQVELPVWLPFTLVAILTGFLWYRDRRTVKPGHCLTCGYDLRASKDKCPECGTPFAAETTIGPGKHNHDRSSRPPSDASR